MPAFTSFAEAQAELVATSDYDVSNDIAKAKRYVAAARAMLAFASASGRGEMKLEFDLVRIETQLQQALSFIYANQPRTDSDRLNNPSVTHADFSGARGYQ